MAHHTQHSRSESGAVLVHAALVLIGLMAMSTFIVDYGVLWAARRQAQNAADAGALAGAVHMLYDTGNIDPTPDVLSTAHAIAVENRVWEAVPAVTSSFECPSYVPVSAMIDCIRVDVYRDKDHGNALPILFGAFLGLDHQNIRATATARVSEANASDCIRPFAVPDYYVGGTYLPPGYAFEDLGQSFTVKEGPPTADADWYRPIDFGGGKTWFDAVVTCSSGTKGIGDDLDKQSAPLKPTEASDAVNMLYVLDQDASYDAVAKRVVNSCAEMRLCDKWVSTGGIYSRVPDPGRTISPRILIIPVFNPDTYVEASTQIHVENFLGFFVSAPPGADQKITGILVTQPGLVKTGAGSPPLFAAFLRAIRLIR